MTIPEIPFSGFPKMARLSRAFTTADVDWALTTLTALGSVAAPGFKDPEGIVVFHIAAGIGFKKTIMHDEVPKSQIK